MHRAAVCAAVIFALSGCGGGNTASSVQAPGAEETAKTKALETGAAVLQDRPPVDAINAYLDGFHFYNGQMKVQMKPITTAPSSTRMSSSARSTTAT